MPKLLSHVARKKGARPFVARHPHLSKQFSTHMNDRARYKAYVAYKAVSDVLFVPAIPPPWDLVPQWSIAEKREELQRLRRMYFRTKLCLERRLRYKFQFVKRDLWDEGHERAIENAKENMGAYQGFLDKFAKIADETNTISTTQLPSLHHEQSTDADQVSGPQITLNIPKPLLAEKAPLPEPEDWAAYKKRADAEVDEIYNGLYDHVLRLMAAYRPELEGLELDALIAVAISLIPVGPDVASLSWLERTVVAQRALAKLPSETMKRCVMVAVETYAPVVSELSSSPDKCQRLMFDSSCPPALRQLGRRAKCVVYHVRRNDKPEGMPDEIFRKMLVINSLLTGAGQAVGDYQLVNRGMTWLTIANMHYMKKGPIEHLFGMTIPTRSLHSQEAIALTMLAAGSHVFKLYLESRGLTTQDHTTAKMRRNFRRLLGPPAQHPWAHHKLIYLILTNRVDLMDAILNPRRFLRAWLLIDCSDISARDMVAVAFCLEHGLGLNIFDTAIYFLRLEGWPEAFRLAVNNSYKSGNVPTEWRSSSFTKPAKSALNATTYEDFVARYPTIDDA